MEYIVSAATDVGVSKNTNQDSFSIKTVDTKLGKIAVAVLCDGMGGLSKGEVASATVIDAFNKWILNRLPVLCMKGITNTVIKDEWTDIILLCNEKIRTYGNSIGIDLGTTLVAIMLTETRYFAVNVGDSRFYEISDNEVKILTNDQTLVAKEVEAGIITEEEAKYDPRRSVLLQCIGASDEIVPEIIFGETKKDTVYMLCSDGFRHEISNDEILEYLSPAVMTETDRMKQNMETLIEINKQRQETDNITVVSIKTY